VYRTIVVGAHKSVSARRAVAEAIELAHSVDAHLHLVAAYPDDGIRADGTDSPARADAERTVNAMVPAGRGRRFTTHALPGDPAKALLTVADEVGADLIVVGNKGMKGRGRVLGSVPNDVAHRASCAVLIVRST
jgi:nucleotide-binding universal stress UspA family protein